VLAIAANGQQWLSFDAREDFLRGFAVGMTVEVARAGNEMMPAVVTALRPLGTFATWQSDARWATSINTLRLRLDPQGDVSWFEQGA
jgi:HlyD family secretion protein